MGWMLLTSMLCTEGLLVMQDRWREAIPLHICSIAALCALWAAWGERKQGAVDFLWYIGMPGAVLALAFPAPAKSSCQLLFNASYVMTHALIVLILIALLFCGIRPRPAQTVRMMLVLQGIALLAFFVNEALDTDFLFLHAPPPNTPLEWVFGRGYPAYLLVLEGMMFSICTLQSRLLRVFEKNGAD